MNDLYETFKVKALLRDPVFYAVLIPVLLPLLPGDVKLYVEANKEAFTALWGYLGLHMGIRLVGTHAAGKAAAAVEPVVVKADIEAQNAAPVPTGVEQDEADRLAAEAEATRLAEKYGAPVSEV